MAITSPTIQWEVLKKAADYRQFLKAYLEVNSLSFSDLARKAGFSRGFPSDVIAGKRRLTSKSYVAFLAALKLSPIEKKLFKFLVAQEEFEIFPELKKNQHDLDLWIQQLKSKTSTQRRETSRAKSAGIEMILKNPDVLSVYAAAGEPGQGATLEKINQRTGLSRSRILAALDDLTQAELILKNTDHYEAQDFHLFFKAQGTHGATIALFKLACQTASKRSEIAMSSEDEFFFTSQFCIERSRLPDLKKALRETVLNFIDESIKADGDQVVHFITGLHT